MLFAVRHGRIGRLRRWYHATAPVKYKTPPYRDIHTLDPAKFLSRGQDWLNLSSVSRPTIRVFANDRESKPVRLAYDYDNPGSATRRARKAWPPHSQGFLYYSSPANRPRIAGELRFRPTPANDPSAFAHGTDLGFAQPLATAQPWKRPLYSIATNTGLRPFYEKLLDEHLVPPDLAKSIASLPKITFMYSRCHLIHTLYDPFALDVSADWFSVVAISENGIATTDLLHQFRDLRFNLIPYTGLVLAQFEPSLLPQHKDTRTVVIRILHELTTVRCILPSYDQYIQHPKPGQLYTRHFHGKLRPWSVDIDNPEKGKSTAAGLKLLWESTPGLESESPR